MVQAHFSGETIDDVMRIVVEEIRRRGQPISPTGGDALELTGVLLELEVPRARLSRTETRGKIYSCLGYLCWYLAGSNDLGFISYYLPGYKDFADGDEVSGGYGPRLFNWEGLNQVARVTDLLRRNRDSRRAVIQLFDRGDLNGQQKNVPCTCTLQFMIRNDALHMFTSMRSNDVFLGLPHDFFCFTMLQEIIARDLRVEVGPYKHAVGSLHLYNENRDAAQQFLNEGWQSTTPMPPMPTGDPWPAIHLLLKVESELRTAGASQSGILESVDSYWADLIRLLHVFRCKKDKDAEKLRGLRRSMSTKVYFPFIDKVLDELA
jgi:thymidylate synthase